MRRYFVKWIDDENFFVRMITFVCYSRYTWRSEYKKRINVNTENIFKEKHPIALDIIKWSKQTKNFKSEGILPDNVKIISWHCKGIRAVFEKF